MAPLVILMSGSSSSGKTSLAKALQRILAVPTVLVEADRVFPVLPVEHSRWPEWTAGHDQNVVLTFHRSIAAWVTAGFNLIVDGSLPYGDASLRDACLELLEPFDLRVVGVRCGIEVLADREQHRLEKRPSGWAARQAADIHTGMRYAAEVDTTDRTAGECAEDVAQQLGAGLVNE